MKLIKLLVLTITFFASDFVSAQQTNVDMTGRIGLIYTKRAESEPATGSQYYIEAFMPARIDNSSEISMVRYNAYSDELEVKVNDEIRVLQPRENQLVGLVNNQAIYDYVPYTDKEGTEMQSYLVVINDNPNLKIYKKERITLIPEQHPTGGYQKYKPAAYKKLDPEYYIRVNDGNIVYTSTKKKDLVKLFPGKEKEIEEFIKKNKLSTSDEKDLEQIGDYISSIL